VSTKRLVGRDDEAGALVASRDELEEQVGGLGLERDVADLDRRGAELLFQVLTEREEKASVAIASNESLASTPSCRKPSPQPPSTTGVRAGFLVAAGDGRPHASRSALPDLLNQNPIEIR
jgi:hypothetical protein